MDYLEKAKRVIALEVDELERLSGRLADSFCEAVDACKQAIDTQRKIVVVGVGKSGNIGYKIAATLNSTGATAVVLHSQNALHGDLGLVQPGDVVLAMSQSGETRELLDLLPYLRRFEVTVIGFTGKSDSSLARHSDIVLDSSVEREACPLNLAPTSSSTVMLVLGDALAMVLLEARGFRGEDFAELHPNGHLGRILLTRVSDVMRDVKHIALVDEATPISQALRRMTDHRAGAAVVLGSHGGLAGVFTHGDFVRAFQQGGSLANAPVAEHMTRNPISIQGQKLATEALQLLDKHRIDDLIVVDGEGRPIGLLDTQDLSRMKLI
ncbi:MAG: KpsF/GutQ family sugar-phosphate isomerase [Verrucomicrobiales bacterium]|nr:KpsF/GutQ family sugar-phosphate isomerase [Verrucomicrobiaceae bacterium]